MEESKSKIHKRPVAEIKKVAVSFAAVTEGFLSEKGDLAKSETDMVNEYMVYTALYCLLRRPKVFYSQPCSLMATVLPNAGANLYPPGAILPKNCLMYGRAGREPNL